MTLFVGPTESLGDIDADSVTTLVEAAGDVALILNSDGVIQNASFHDPELSREFDPANNWLGHPWGAIVGSQSRPKVDALMHEALAAKPPRWVHVNHPSKRGADIPILYAAVQVGDAGKIVAIGRDLRATSVLHQRLVDAQQAMERDYLRLRHVEARYRLLFQMSSEAVLIVDPSSHRTLEANPAAHALFGSALKQSPGPVLFELFDRASVPAIESFLVLVRTTGRAEEAPARAGADHRRVLISASLFRQDNDALFLVRVAPAEDALAKTLSHADAALLSAIVHAPDGFLLTSPDGRVLASNAAFRDMVQLATEEQARTASLDQWLGRPGIDLNVLTATLRQRGSVSLFSTTLRGELGATIEVEISAVAVANDGQTCYGFIIRNVGRRIPVDSRIGRDVPRSVDQLTELIGRVPLKDLVREATDMIERLCILAALELTGDNRASAAELLGLSRQSLYVKLRRHGLGDLAGDGENSE